VSIDLALQVLALLVALWGVHRQGTSYKKAQTKKPRTYPHTDTFARMLRMPFKKKSLADPFMGFDRPILWFSRA
jgi:hypothetical protein